MNKLTILFALVLSLIVLASPSDAQVSSDAGNDATLEENSFFHRTVRVNCDQGRTIEHALRRWAQHLTIEISGSCNEDVLIRRDDVTLRGRNASAELVGGIRVDGASRVEISGFTVRDSATFESCIEAVNGAAIRVTDMVVQDCAQRGIRLRNATGEIIDSTALNVGDVGFLARGSSMTLEGAITSTNAGLVGISVTDGSNLFSKGGDLVVTGSGWGIIVQLASSFSNPEGTITTSGNAAAGILVATNGSFVYGTELTSTNNTFSGVWVDESSTFSSFQDFVPEVDISGNFFGFFAERGANIELAGNTVITNNSFGLVSDDSLIRSTDVTITGNFVADALIRFGSRANFVDNNTVGVIQCDADVSVRGDVACP